MFQIKPDTQHKLYINWWLRFSCDSWAFHTPQLYIISTLAATLKEPRLSFV